MMKHKIHYTDSDHQENFFIIEGDEPFKVRQAALKKLEELGGTDPWSETFDS